MNQSKKFLIPVRHRVSFVHRFWIYLRERFPLLKHALLIATFTFSAIGYSRLSRRMEGFVDWTDYLAGVFITFSLFLLLRISDEFKDKEEDAKFRKYLPVPRGLIDLRELKYVAFVVIGLQILVIALFQPELWKLYLLVLAYLGLMRVEFFIPSWLKQRQIAYVVSHMMIIPLVDCYASGIDWLSNGAQAPVGLLFFFLVSFLNGIVLEIGRKIKTPETEEPGVVSYTSLYGTKSAVVLWLAILICTAMTSFFAARFAGFSFLMQMVFPIFMAIMAIPGMLFIKEPSIKKAKQIENASGIWTLGMYLFLGGLPMLLELSF